MIYVTRFPLAVLLAGFALGLGLVGLVALVINTFYFALTERTWHEALSRVRGALR